MVSSSSIAIIGAGISGLACANVLKKRGIACEIFEKSRGPGGRLASRRLGEGTVDLGAQYFTAHDERFCHEVTAWRSAGVVKAWPGRLGICQGETIHYPEAPPLRYCGAPRMSALTRHLAQDMNVRVGCRIESRERQVNGWWLIDDKRQRQGPFSAGVISVPTPQAVPLVAPHDPALVMASEAVVQHPTWTAYAVFDKPLDDSLVAGGDWQGLFVEEGPLDLVARNSTKPGREPRESLTLLATHAWTQACLEEKPSRVADWLYQAFAARFTTRALPEPLVLSAHRWRYAKPSVSTSKSSGEDTAQDFHLTDTGLGLCGDAWRGARVEDAWLSGHHLGLALAS